MPMLSADRRNHLMLSCCLILFASCQAFVTLPPTVHHPSVMEPSTALASVSASSTTIAPIHDDIQVAAAAHFMVDSFWLSSPQGLVLDDSCKSDALVQEQLVDFQEKYGEIMGKRVLDTRLLGATSDSELVGLVGVEMSLLDKDVGDVISATKSQSLLQNAVASLGPKQRRQYKSASVQQIALELLPPHLEPICVLSNLVVSPAARRQGLAQQLCQAVEEVVRDEWNYSSLYLRVEAANEAARTLYETKLGFSMQHELSDATGVRVEGNAFIQVPANIWVMSKEVVMKK